MPSTLIVNARLVNEGREFDGDLRFEDGRIAQIGTGLAARANESVIDAGGRRLLPGMIDDQVHFREPGLEYKADLATESAAAVAGGLTTFMDMLNTNPPTLDAAALEDVHDGARLGVLAWLCEHGLVHVRVERTVRLDLDEPLLLQRRPERALDELHAVDERRLFVALRGLERPLQVIEHGKELPDEALVRVRDQALLVAGRPLAVVLEVGLHALQEAEILVPLGLQGGDALVVELGGVGLDRLHPFLALRHDFVASSSSRTSKSASSTTSSSAAAPLPVACDAAWADACA